MALKHILAINPGSTSTKIAVYTNTKVIFLKSIHHTPEELGKFKKIGDQYEYRKDLILKELKNAKIEMDLIEAIVGRGGLLRPIKSGIYTINEKMKKDLQKGILGQHASNLGGLIADDIAKSLPNANAYIADPVVVDEMNRVAKITGHPDFKRISIFHALNQKATARSYARLLNKKYEELNLILAHMGGGISVGAHQKGRVIDVNNGLDGDGPFSPERSGTLPTGQLVDKCFEEGTTKEYMKEVLTGKGGLMAYFGTNSAYQIELQALEGDENARLIQDAMSYQVAKEIGAMATVLRGEVDGIILTGGIANNPMVVEYIKKMVTFIAPVIIYPGEDEMHALAMNGMLVLRGEVNPKVYNEDNFVE
ncbi:MAG: butyrate kinase [Bacteroidales bacterium]|nr:butyrate kinase [Bacteroidales bacterium]